MKVLLLENIQSLGKKGDVVEVKDGYGQNFLIAKGKAKHATNEVINRYKAEQKNLQEQLALQEAQRQALAKQLQELKIVLSKKAGESGALFGAITKDEISQALQAQHHISIDKKHIEIDTSIKHTGSYEVCANLGNGIHAKFHLEVLGD
ncbi:50S ribosomal protein L9 [Helicobacter enhydrae]|uniref:Large ribosomal subunit protein bL9 n=1 Tax=Helicobacter enhydrae TaxID=222136 RepID=A0A1B1U3Y8_9HELI|nr:50S ribosomal protein L9 [Helicobacter enhydrae]ANV97468.1 50S ribosomal protein L9 [Helicobacter enhydrae]